MAKYYEQQSLLTILLDTTIDISTASQYKVLYTKPDGTTGQWTATYVATTKLKYALQAGDIDQDGVWEFQAFVKIGTLDGYGEIIQENFEERVHIPT